MYDVKEAYRSCEKIIAHHSKTFYKAFSILPKVDRQAVWAVYAFCRTVDDIVDEGENSETELARFTSEFKHFLSGVYDLSNPMWVALHDVFRRYQMDEQYFFELIKGQEMDLTINRYDTMDQLLDYCYHVASTVGLMLLPILAPKKVAVLKDGAISLGLAMQVTNILRDIGEDLERDRIYLPNDVMKRHGVTEESLGSRNVDASFVEVWEQLAEQAEGFYQEAFQTLKDYPVYSRIPVKSAAYLYREILTAVRSKKYHVFHEKHFVTDQTKQRILVNM